MENAVEFPQKEQHFGQVLGSNHYIEVSRFPVASDFQISEHLFWLWNYAPSETNMEPTKKMDPRKRRSLQIWKPSFIFTSIISSFQPFLFFGGRRGGVGYHCSGHLGSHRSSSTRWRSIGFPIHYRRSPWCDALAVFEIFWAMEIVYNSRAWLYNMQIIKHCCVTLEWFSFLNDAWLFTMTWLSMSMWLWNDLVAWILLFVVHKFHGHGPW